MKLFRVSTTKWDEYYVLAKDYNEARDKTIEYLKHSVKLFDRDKSLVVTEDSINEIRLLTDEIIR
jgi:hypothetical protein